MRAPTKNRTKIAVVVVAGFVLILVIVSVVMYKGLSSCGSASSVANSVNIPSSFQFINTRQIECNNFIGGYPNKLQNTYDVSNSTPADFEALKQAIKNLGFTENNKVGNFTFAKENEVPNTYSYIRVQFSDQESISQTSSNKPEYGRTKYAAIYFDIKQ